MLGVPAHLLRQWEGRFPQLRPRRNRTNRRYYLDRDIEVARRIKQLIRDEGLNTEGARRRLEVELAGSEWPQTNQQLLELVDSIESDVRRLMDILDPDTAPTLKHDSKDCGEEPPRTIPFPD